MKKRPSFITALLLCALTAAPALATKVKRKNGQIVEGKIAHTIVLKRTTTAKGKAFAATYVLVSGYDIDSIDENGVRANGYYTIIDASRNRALDNVDIVRQGLDYRGGVQFTDSSDGTSLMIMGVRFDKPNSKTDAASPDAAKYGRYPLLGEYRCDEGKCRIVPALEIGTDQGKLKVPVIDVIAFTRANVKSRKTR